VKRAIIIRHVSFEDLGVLAPTLAARGYQTHYYDAGIDDLSHVSPDAGDILVVLGGPISAYEEAIYPFIAGEIRLIELALRQRTPTLGICLGAQLLARALGARVYPGKAREVGIGPVTLTSAGLQSCLKHLNEDRLVLHWHGDTFDLPSGAERLASTDVTPNQAFAFGKAALGLQFHIEAEPANFERWLIGHAHELASAGIDIARLRGEAASKLPGIAQAGMKVVSDCLAAFDERAP
jgi:GMP synthase (glutamine-hydrolysing)